ncbi:DMT family transporter [Clostridium sp. HV4-5-A1G]|jgi:drug/metabolite transporter (DMT)-like permease|uniref:DMT family transporter n=1 Tax=Clostridium sp. HV4-5-A1G TaxID=2004595 RepID=UPI00123C0D85|nr:DMT family transporter [Clostridium sp. HV4-5-A1G]KAA8668126.1 DMT family transporter [Clostridium sp. HV4-5-A1G]
MNNKRLSANILLLITSAIWGFAFVAQRVGAQYVGAFTFNGTRFALGSISLIPLIIYFNEKKKYSGNYKNNVEINLKRSILPGALVGIVLFAGSTLQQIGLSYTTAGKASFITGLYMVFVPIISIFLKHKIEKSLWIGVVFAVVGLYLLSVNENFSISYGDLFEIIGAIFWAVHILMIDYFSDKVNALKLCCAQFAVCSFLSLIMALIFENIILSDISQALVPILYGGLLSVGVAYTLQAIAQKNAKPSHAAIILSMESVFGAVGGVLLLGENMSGRGYTGCALILVGIIVSQLNSIQNEHKAICSGFKEEKYHA